MSRLVLGTRCIDRKLTAGYALELRDVAKLMAAIPQLIGFGLTTEQVASSLGLTIAEVEQEIGR